MRKATTTIVILLCTITISFAASIEKAILFNQHGLTTDAKRELIEVIFHNRSKQKDKAKAYYLLGNIAFAENKIKVALNSWNYLVKNYPKSDEAMLVGGRIAELSEIVRGDSKETIDNAIARSYLKNAEFWSESNSDAFQIDSSWIPKMEAAVKWYDKVITEFRNTNAARIAYEGKLDIILAHKAFDASESRSHLNKFAQHILLLVKMFEDFEREYPDASSLQAFRYQIAQVYWIRHLRRTNLKYVRYLELARGWFEKVIQKGGTNDSFYRDLAQRRLENLKPR
jgi:hypothetical protein